MSESEVKPETTSVNNEEVDIYSDVLSDQDSLITKLKEKVEKLSKEKELMLKSLTNLQKSYEELRKENGELQEKYKVVSFNSSALFKTAQAEIKRKDRMIAELRKEKDDLVFRKVSTSQAVQRARRFLTPKKYRSPIKKQNVEESQTPDQSPEPNKEALKELKNSSPIKQSSEDNDSVTKGTTSTYSYNQQEVGDKSQETVELLNDKIIDTPENTKVSNTVKYIPPPLNGPLTAYSKRLYKRTHGVSPPKAVQEKSHGGEDKLPKKPEALSEVISEEMETKPKNEVDCKVESVASKLQKEIKEIIRLGNNLPSKTSPPTTTKLSKQQDQLKHKQNSTPTMDEKQTQNSCKPLADKLIIQCDLRNNSKYSHKNLANSVSINETIDNILKKQRAGLFSPNSNVANNKKEGDPKSNNLDRCLKGKTGGRLLTNLNRRTTDKLTISPATFGKLIPQSAKSTCNDVTPPNKEKFGNMSPVKGTTDSRKRKLSESLSSPTSVSPKRYQRPRRETCPETLRKSNFITSLFGESPLKRDITNKNDLQPSPTKKTVELKTPSSTDREHSISPIFPDSSSLDSNNTEDLVIDTTACSQNTSPRVSESGKKDLNEIDTNVPVKVPFSLNNKYESDVLSKDVAKETVIGIESSNTDSRDSSTKLNSTNKENNNSPVTNKVISRLNIDDNQEKTENTISVPVEIKPKELSACLPASDELKNELLVSNSINPSEIVENPVRNEHPETSHSSASLNKISSPEKSGESQPLAAMDNKNATLHVNTKDEISVRFIPSPPQLTLVSAFKHSENSVFALAEDTIGFVAALTRMRDISPIRTPDKRSKSLSIPLLQSQQTEPVESECSNHKESETLKNSTYEFLKPLDQGFHNHSGPLSIGLNKIGSQSTNYSKIINPPPEEKLSSATSCSSQPFGKPENINDNSNKEDMPNTKTSGSIKPSDDQPSKISISPHKEYIVKILETSGIRKPKDDSNINKTQSIKQNPFRRTIPVRRITAKSKINSKLSATSNIPSVQLTTQTKHEGPSKAEMLPDRENSEQANNSNKLVREVVVSRSVEVKSMSKKVPERQDCNPNLEEFNSSKKENNIGLADSTVNMIVGKTILNCDKKTVQSVSTALNECSTKIQPLQSIVSGNSDEIKTFKRSESLKMMQKPLPRNYLNLIEKTKANNSEDVHLEISGNKNRCEELKFRESKPGSKPNSIKDIDKNSELNQISHIESINKKLRVSKYQNKPDKENVNQHKVSETVGISDKISNDLSETSVAKGKIGGTPGTMIEINKHKLPSKSLNRSPGEKRQTHRRSVSLGPESRLGIHTNLPPLNRNKHQLTTLSYSFEDSNKIKPIGKLSENKIMMKSCSKEIKDKPGRNSDDNLRKEGPNKGSVLKKSPNTSVFNNQESERKINHRSRSSSSPNPRIHQSPQKCPIKSKSPPDVEKRNHHVLRRSLSRSPASYKRSRSSYKVSPRKCPDIKRVNYHRSRRSHDRSPEHKRTKSNCKYSPRRSDSGGRSRRYSRYDDYRRRSPSPDCRHRRYSEKKHRSRSFHYKHRHKNSRSRSQSPELKHRKFDIKRSGYKNRSYTRRSRSRSSSLSCGRRSRSCSPRCLKSDSFASKNVGSLSKKCSSDKIGNINLQKGTDNKLDQSNRQVEESKDSNTILSYKDELEKMKRDIEMIRTQVNKNEDVIPKDSPLSSLNSKNRDHSLQYPIEEKRSLEASVDNTVKLLKTKMSYTSDKIDGCIKNVQEECVINKTKVIELPQRPFCALKTGGIIENLQCLEKQSSDQTLFPLEKPKPIKVKRRNRSLGDSEVQVVSIK